MATDLEQKPRAAAKYDTFVEEQLTKVRGRVRALDAGKITLLLLIVTLAYALGMAVVDRALELPAAIRLGAFLIYLVIAAGLVGWILLCLARRINPYYAAKKLEETLPDAKNSVVNWLDLRDEELPPVIHNALGTRAARDLKQADPERAVSAGPTWILAGVMAGLILGLLILFVMGPTQFGSLLQRAFTPFFERTIDTRVSIQMLLPSREGDATVSPNRAVTFRASIDGPVPAINKEGAPHLHYRFNAADPFVAQPLDVDADGTWAWTMPADRVLNGGLWYKIAAGDAETPEYLIRVVPNPQVLNIDVTYHYRKYLCKPDASATYPKSFFNGLYAPRGTEVTLVVHANSAVTKGWLHVDWAEGKKEEIKGEIAAADPNAIRFSKIFLDKGGFFSIKFTSGAEDNIDRDPHRIVVFKHGKPRVEITKPDKINIELPADGTLVVEGFANSGHPEIGIQSMSLGMRVRLKEGDKKATLLESKPFRPTKSFKLVNGKYPPDLKYMDFLALDKVKTDKGVRFPLAKGMELEYWLEARDNTDYPDKNGARAESSHYFVKIVDPEADKKKQEQERNHAKKEQEKHEQQQNQDLDKQNDAAKKEQDANKTEDQKRDEQLKNEKEKLNNDAKNIQDKINKEQQKENSKGEAKGGQDEKEKGNAKPGSADPKKDPQPDDAKAKDNKQGQDSACKSKGGGQPDKGTEAKGPDQNDPNKKDSSAQAKNGGQNNPEAGPKGNAKEDQGKGGQNEKSAAKDQPEKQAGSAKDQGMKEGPENTGQAKGSENMKTDPKEHANNKEAGKEQPGGQAKGSKEAGGEKTTQKSDTKKGPGPKDDKSQAKGKEPGGETKVSEGKKGPVDSVQDAKGLTKGEDSVENQSGAKGGTSGEKGPKPLAKSPGSGKGPPQAASKKSDPNQTKDAAQARDDKGPRKQPTAEEIEKWIKDLAQKDPKIQDKAERELRNAQEARDPKIRDAVQEALEKANKTAMKAKGAGNSEDKTAKAESKDKGNGQGQGQVKQGNDKDGGQGKGDPSPDDIAQAKGGDKVGGSGPGGKGMADDPKANDPDSKSAKRGGDLTLEDLKSLKDKLTAEKRKQAGVTDKEWQQFLKSIQDYEDMLARQQATGKNNPDKSKGTKSALKTFDPFKLGPTVNQNVDPLNTGQFQAPPEFRDAQRRFTLPPEPEKKK